MGFWDIVGSRIGTLLLIISTLERIIPENISWAVERFFQKLVNYFDPYVEITFDEFPPEGNLGRSKAYFAIQTYLGTNFSRRADRLKARISRDSRDVVLSMDDYEEITDVYRGVSVSWLRNKSVPRSNVISVGKAAEEEKRAYVLSFRRKHSDVVMGPYLSYVLSEGKAMAKRTRRQRLYTNVQPDYYWGGEEKMMWQSAAFDHPATFETLAMDPEKKRGIMEDLVAFSKAKDYYKSIGKPWKRGYLLYGPPGTGKSSMIAAMANFLHYDVYDLELTAVEDNIELRKLMMEISKRAIVVIEDVDCSLHITGKRKGKKGGDDFVKAAVKGTKEEDDEDDEEKSKVTLSGLLNFMDGLYSACSGGERIFVLTTNHLDDLDEALIRRGRMDNHVHMSYCCFEAFKVLARNYLKLESHAMFETVRCLLSETEISPADVAEILMPTTPEMTADKCLENLIVALRQPKKQLKPAGNLKRRIKGVFSKGKNS